jgi:UDP-N-acetylmuramoyl-tripeptide--D-alanyl-D-alanine ligase
MVHWLEIIYLIILLQGLGRCLYYWQLKEYRWDRFQEVKLSAYWLPHYRLLLPRLTFKILLLGYLAVYLSVLIITYFPHQLLAPLAAYFLLPLSAAAAVILLQPMFEAVKLIVVLGAKMKLWLGHRRLLVIGITGSFGKTSTKEILAHILATKYKVAKTPGTNNTLIGVALTVWQLPLAAEILVAEMGAYKIGEIAAICRLLRPRIGVLTGINEQHLRLFGSLANTIRAKSELLAALPKNGLAVVNGVNRWTKKLRAPLAPTRYYRPGRYRTNLLGAHQQLNLSAAVTVARYLGYRRFDLTNIPRFKTALTQSRGLNGALVINDSYNSNPDGFLAAVAYAKTIPAKSKILVSPGIIELGQAKEAVYRRLSAEAALVFDFVWISQPEKFLLTRLRSLLNPNTLLLIEGRFSPKFIQVLCPNPS